MKALPKKRLPDYDEYPCIANKYGIIRVGRHSYSIARDYRGETLRAQVYETKIELKRQKDESIIDTLPIESVKKVKTLTTSI